MSSTPAAPAKGDRKFAVEDHSSGSPPLLRLERGLSKDGDTGLSPAEKWGSSPAEKLKDNDDLDAEEEMRKIGETGKPNDEAASGPDNINAGENSLDIAELNGKLNKLAANDDASRLARQKKNQSKQDTFALLRAGAGSMAGGRGGPRGDGSSGADGETGVLDFANSLRVGESVCLTEPALKHFAELLLQGGFINQTAIKLAATQARTNDNGPQSELDVVYIY